MQLKIDAALASDVSPKTVMIRTMQALWHLATAEPGKIDLLAARDAHAVAKDLAPYVHPRLSSIEGNPDKPLIPAREVDLLDTARRAFFILRTIEESAYKKTEEQARRGDKEEASAPN